MNSELLLKVLIFLPCGEGGQWDYLTLFEGVGFLFISSLVISKRLGASDPFILLQSLGS